ncbi:MAG: transketolase [Nitrospiraceae bacterium]|nr:MAG: transketolase [Nitrospiraceae bacterium]
MRKALADTLTSLAEKDPSIVFLTGDLGFQMFDEFGKRFSGRYINVGVAEAQMICAAAGMALEGFRPFVYSIAPFATGRPFEHIKISIAYHGLPVTIIGAGGGYAYATNGPTHHGADDIALMSIIPGMTVMAPGSPAELRELLPQIMKLKGPAYIRIGKKGDPEYDADGPAIIGKARLLKSGEKIAIVSTGEMAPIALDAAKKLALAGINPVVYQMHTIKPLDTVFLNEISEKVDTILIVEEASPIGGLWSAVSSFMASCSRHPKIIRTGPPDEMILGNCSREELRQNYGFDTDAIVNICKKLTGLSDIGTISEKEKSLQGQV